MLETIKNIIYGLTGPMQTKETLVNEITSTDELDQALASTDEKPAFIFKHSTACPISAGAYRRVSEYVQKHEEGEPAFYLVKVIESRPVSTAVADKLGVDHQSPQLILVDHGKAVWDTSHHNINAENIDKALDERPA